MKFINSNKNKWYNGTITTHMFNIIIIIIIKEMICLQHFFNIFTINFKWYIITCCYYLNKKIILTLV